MKVAVIYNRDSKSVINLFGVPSRERYGKKNIKRITDGLKQYGHQVVALEGDKELINNLEDFMPRVLKGERPGMVFNLSYGIQGQARYTHVPGILEMIGIPYVGSGPLAHSLSLDKVVAKMIFRQHGLPTPDFAVLGDPDFESPGLEYPLIVKPRNEAVSMGIEIVNNDDELREAVQNIITNYGQEALVERYIEGREINVGLLGNNPPEAFPPCEITFGEGGPQIYTIEDKKGQSGREISYICPADIGKELTEEAQKIAINAFTSIGCYDCARVDMRLDNDGNLHILEMNSLPSLGAHGSYTMGAEHVGLDFPALVNRLIEVASARYFGTPSPPMVKAEEKDSQRLVFSFLTERRDQIERRLREWTSISSRTSDPVGKRGAVDKLDKMFADLRLKTVKELTDPSYAYTWQTAAGLEGGTLFIGHLDVPLELDGSHQGFRRGAERIFGEGIGTSRGPLVMLEFALRSLRSQRRLRKLPIGVLYYLDEGQDARYSSELITEATSRAKRVFILRPGKPDNKLVVQRRGRRKYSFTAEGKPQRLGQRGKSYAVLPWAFDRISEITKLSSRKENVAISPIDVNVNAFSMLLPHRVTATLLLNYLDPKIADGVEKRIREILKNHDFHCNLEMISDRPPMKERRIDKALANSLVKVADEFEIPLATGSVLFPSAGGLVPAKIPVVCGIGPVAYDLYTPQESIDRISIMQRTLLISEFLAKEL
jgi:D-alanine-D-alanine ligase